MDLNHVTLTGMIERDPQTRFAESGGQVTTFTLRLTEAGSGGKTWALYVPCEVYGEAADVAGELSAGASLLVAGKLKWTSTTAKDGSKKSSLAVLARLVKRLQSTAAEVSI